MYEIYENGKIYSKFINRFIKDTDDGRGYRQVSIVDLNGKKITTKVHILVAKAFVKNPQNKLEINHLDCNKKNNHYSNLAWCTRSENMMHAGKHSNYNREKASPITEDMVLLIPDLVNNGLSVKLISKLYKVSHITIRCILAGKRWRNLNLTFNRVSFKRDPIIFLPKHIYNKLKSFDIDNTVLNNRIKELLSV